MTVFRPVPRSVFLSGLLLGAALALTALLFYHGGKADLGFSQRAFR